MNEAIARSIGISLNTTLKDGMEVWLYRFKKNGVKQATFERLTVSYRLTLQYSIACMRIMELTTIDVQDYINALQRDSYSYSTIRKQYNLISAFVKFLIGEGLAVRPSYINVTLPIEENTGYSKRDVVTYDKMEQMKLVPVAERSNKPGAKAAILMLESGMRTGEALALSWGDVLWDRRAIRIHKTLVHPASTRRGFIQDSPKSRTSDRTVPLSRRAYAMLEEWFERAPSKGKDALVFCRPDDPNKSIGYNALRNHVMEICAEAGLDYRGMHVFRRTFATNCYYKGCEIKKLSKLLGHTSVTITYNTYIHLYGDALEELRSIID